MQQDHVLKKNEFRPFDLRVWEVCEQNVCYHVAAFVITFNWIFNMTMFLKSRILTFCPHSRVKGGVCGWGLVCGQNICYHVAAFVISLNLHATYPCSEKVDFCPFDPIPVSRGGGVGWGAVEKCLLPCFPLI